MEFYRKKAAELRNMADQLQTLEAQNVFYHLADSYELLPDELTRLFLKE